MKRLLLLGILASCLGCRAPQPIPYGAEVIIKRSHIHSRYCGHYRFGQRWYYVRQHRHGVGCGHELVEGVWILTT